MDGAESRSWPLGRDTIKTASWLTTVERYDVSQNRFSFEKTRPRHLIFNARLLFTAKLVSERNRHMYPEELAVAMVQEASKSPVRWSANWPNALRIPDALRNNCAIVRWLLNLLIGPNRIYHPGFKWTPWLKKWASNDWVLCGWSVFSNLSGTPDPVATHGETFDLVENAYTDCARTATRDV